MELLDIRSNADEIYSPIQKVGNKIICEKIKRVGYSFLSHRVFGYYEYNTKSKKIRKLGKCSDRIYKSVVYSKDVEGENSIYYVTRKRQIKEDDYIVYKIDLESEDEKEIFRFSEESKYSDIMVESLNEDYICVFSKEQEELDLEMKTNFNTKKYGYDKGCIYNIKDGSCYQIKDNTFLRGLRQVFFKTEIGGEKCIVYEENYMDTWDKEQTYQSVNRKGSESTSSKFYYKDSLKIMPLENFIQEIKQERENLQFCEMASKDYEGYEMFVAADKENIYFLLKDFEKMNEEMAVFLDRKTMKRKVYTIKDNTEIDEKTGDVSGYIKILYSLDSRYKGIFAHKLIDNNVTYVKEVMNGDMEYTYPLNLGSVHECLESRYLIASSEVNWDEVYTNIIDIESNKVKQYKGYSKVIDDKVILF